MSQHKRPKVQRNLERRMQFVFSERLYDDLILAIEEIRGGEQKQMSEVNSDATDVWNIQSD
jgi:hypothetical protein